MGLQAQLNNADGSPPTARTFTRVRYYINVPEARRLWWDYMVEQGWTGVFEIFDFNPASSDSAATETDDLE